MTLAYQVFCLIITLFTMQLLIVSRFHSYSHRLLPLILGLYTLYEFYLIIELTTGAYGVFRLLKELLLIQVLAIVFYYAGDQVYFKMHNMTHVGVISLVVVMDVLALTNYESAFFHYVLLGYIIFILGSGAYLLWESSRNKRKSSVTRMNNRLLLIAFGELAIALVVMEIFGLPENYVMPFFISISCAIMIYLFQTDRLRETYSVLTEEMFQTMEEAIFLFEPDFFYLDAGKKAKELFPGYIEEMEKHPDGYPFRERLMELEKNGGETELTLDEVPYKVTLTEALFAGKKKGYIVILTDISAQKHETELVRSVQKQKSDFMAGMSHDLRSPLHAIIGGSEILLEKDEMSGSSVKLVQKIHEAGENLLDMVNSLLDYAKLEEGNLVLVREEYSLKELIERQARIAQINADRKHLTILVEAGTDYPESVVGDELRVRQIIQNLLNNAIKFTGQGTITCTVKASYPENGVVQIEIRVKDTGIGMSADKLQTIFERYVSYAGQAKEEGFGIGLANVKFLTEMMDGDAAAYSDGPGHGSEFVVHFKQLLPYGTDMVKAFAPKPPEVIYTAKKTKNSFTPNCLYPDARVLVCDDLEVNLEIFKGFAGNWGLTVDTALSGEEVLEKVRDTAYDLVILDMMMPGMSGMETSDRLEGSGLVRVLFTADTTQNLQEESKKHGFAGYLEKPLKPEALQEVLDRFLPKTLRRAATDVGSCSQPELSKKVLTSYVKECKLLCEQLNDYYNEDIALFRNKVHGIKGTSKQLGYQKMGSFSEAMEMAAKCDHRNFIEEHMERYLGELRETLAECEGELQRLAESEESSDAPAMEMDEQEKQECLASLRDALYDYDISMGEEALNRLKGAAVSDREREVLEAVEELVQDFEYEQALAKLKEYYDVNAF